MLRNIRMVIGWLFRWGKRAKFAMDMAQFFGLWKMVFSFMTGLLAAVASWRDTNVISPFWFVAVGFAVTLFILNAGWSLINRWQNSKHIAWVANEDNQLRIREISALEVRNEEARLQREQREKEIDPQHRAYNEDRFGRLQRDDRIDDQNLTIALRWLVTSSSWGRWRDAESLRDNGHKLNELSMMQNAIWELQTKAQEGRINICGWSAEKKALELILIDTLVNKATLSVHRDDRTIWQVSLVSRPKCEVASYSYLVTDMNIVREIWPESDPD